MRLRDHGGEIIGGLSEVYAAVSFADEGKKQQYKLPLYTILDKILKFGRAERGLFYNVINPTTGEIIDAKVADTWGYILDAYYTVYQIDGHKPYRDAVTNALAGLQANYTKVNWEKGSADGDADTIESALNLYNREPLAGVDDWIDAQIRVMWQKQLIPGRWRYKRWIFSPIVEGWHGDGNFIRTSLMYGLWKRRDCGSNRGGRTCASALHIPVERSEFMSPQKNLGWGKSYSIARVTKSSCGCPLTGRE